MGIIFHTSLLTSSRVVDMLEALEARDSLHPHNLGPTALKNSCIGTLPREATLSCGHVQVRQIKSASISQGQNCADCFVFSGSKSASNASLLFMCQLSMYHTCGLRLCLLRPCKPESGFLSSLPVFSS